MAGRILVAPGKGVNFYPIPSPLFLKWHFFSRSGLSRSDEVPLAHGQWRQRVNAALETSLYEIERSRFRPMV